MTDDDKHRALDPAIAEQAGEVVKRLTDEHVAASRTEAADLISVLLAQNAALRGALHNCVGMLDCLVAESGRSIEWDQEDPFRMGEWFEPDDLKQLAQARAALTATATTEEGHE